MEQLSTPSIKLRARSCRLPGLLYELGSRVLATMARFALCLYYVYHVHCERRCYKRDGSAKDVMQSLSLPWRVLHFPIRCNVCLTNLAIFLFLKLRIFTWGCDDKLKSPEDTSSTASNISRGCWLLWRQVRVISSSIFLWLCAGGGFGKNNLDVQALVLLFIHHMWLIAKDRVSAKRCAYSYLVHCA